MAGLYLLALIAGLVLEVYGVVPEITEPNTGAVFVPQQAANSVLRRYRRYNSGKLEEIHKDNLERECIEELCTMEEAREVFEDNEKTLEFWASYIDGDQCVPPPCQNGGQCKDGVSTYVCWCQPNFSGKNCEIEVTKLCLVNNGGCSHFCMMQGDQPVCKCASGYKLGPDRRSCLPTGPFSCGHTNNAMASVPRSFINPQSSNVKNTSDTLNFTSAQWDYDDYNDNITQLFDDYNYPIEDFDPHNTSVIHVHSMKPQSSVSIDPAEGELGGMDLSSDTEMPTKKSLLLSFGLPTLPTIINTKNTDTKIVGGDEASPGEIPWQVALMTHSPSLGRAQSFCGGSLLSEQWVITAAHCLMTSDVLKEFFVRVGEHDLKKDEGSERDYMVAEHHIHHMYNYNKSPYNHDIALLKLATPVELASNRRPICLGPKDFTESILRNSNDSLVSGWGRIKYLGIESETLQKLQVPYVERTTCKQSSHDHITRFMFCAGFQNVKRDSCQGDSGGPHATQYKGTWFLTGIVSWGEECAKDGKYGIYTRVSRYYQWISLITGIQTVN